MKPDAFDKSCLEGVSLSGCVIMMGAGGLPREFGGRIWGDAIHNSLISSILASVP